MWWKWLLLAAFMRPLVEAFLVVIGEWWFHVGFATKPERFSRLIIQITTIGREEARVQEIIRELHAMGLSMPYQIWVVSEPDKGDVYRQVDQVLRPPADFTARSKNKARALEFSRQFREQEGLDTDEVKLLFLDDDTSPTRAYVEAAFAGNYDICQGITAPRIQFGSRPFRHFLLSHMDNMRFLSCQIYCSFFQGVLKRPLYVHGEGLCMTGRTESLVTWNYPIFASEDLVFGSKAADLGLKWGFLHEYIMLTSPWTWGAYLKQRRRWLWGNIMAITNREVMSLWPATLISAKYLAGFLTFGASLAAVVLIWTGDISVDGLAGVFFWASFGAWIAAFALAGWVNSGYLRQRGRVRNGPRLLLRRCWHSLWAVLLIVPTVSWTILALLIALLMGNPGRFEVIAKTKAAA